MLDGAGLDARYHPARTTARMAAAAPISRAFVGLKEHRRERRGRCRPQSAPLKARFVHRRRNTEPRLARAFRVDAQSLDFSVASGLPLLFPLFLLPAAFFFLTGRLGPSWISAWRALRARALRPRVVPPPVAPLRPCAPPRPGALPRPCVRLPLLRGLQFVSGAFRSACRAASSRSASAFRATSGDALPRRRVRLPGVARPPRLSVRLPPLRAFAFALLRRGFCSRRLLFGFLRLLARQALGLCLARLFGDRRGFEEARFLGGPRGSLLTSLLRAPRRLTRLLLGFGSSRFFGEARGLLSVALLLRSFAPPRVPVVRLRLFALLRRGARLASVALLLRPFAPASRACRSASAFRASSARQTASCRRASSARAAAC